MDEKKLQAFIQWLPTKYPEFQDKTPDEIAQALNDLFETGEKGKDTLQTLWLSFEEDNKVGMFKDGGKLDSLVQKMRKGGRAEKKCACGCRLVAKKKAGGMIEECACGCKLETKKAKQVESYQEGGIPTQSTSWAGRRFGMPYKVTETSDNKGKANIAQMLTKNNTLYRVIGRPTGTYENKTWQIIQDQGTPYADTTFVSPRGNAFTPQQAPTWTDTFNRLFGTAPITRIKK